MLHYQYNHISLCNNIPCLSVPHGASSHNSSSSFLAAPPLNEWCCFISPLPGSRGGAAEFVFALYPPRFDCPQLPGQAGLYQIRPSVSFLFASACCLTISPQQKPKAKTSQDGCRTSSKRERESSLRLGRMH